jgi:hypothetical protein
VPSRRYGAGQANDRGAEKPPARVPALLGDDGGAGKIADGESKFGGGGGGFFADVGDADGVGLFGHGRRAGDGADFFGVGGEDCAGGGRLVCAWEAKSDAAAVDLAAGTDAFDDFLAGVAAFRVTDVGVFEAGFVRDLFVAEVVAEPWDGLFEAESVEGFVADRAAADGARFFGEEIPELFDVFAVDTDVGGWRVGQGFFCDGARDCIDSCFDAAEIRELVEVCVHGEIVDELRRLRPYERERGVAIGFVGQRYVVHDDEFFQRVGEMSADHCGRDTE